MNKINKTFFVWNLHQNVVALRNNHTKLEFDVGLDPKKSSFFKVKLMINK